jgi:g-D-glutamyl-meso-diaminopimelate peptidase
MKNTIITVLVLAVIGAGIYYWMKNPNGSAVKVDNSLATTTNSQATSTPAKVEGSEVVIGKSVDGKDIVAYNYGSGEKRIVLIGGVHGGYSWNTALVAYEMMDYLKANPNVIPKNVKVTIIPVLNPDGLNEAVGTSSKFAKSSVSTSNAVLIASRFNSNNVDLSRNFDCDWKATGVWQTKPVSGGSKPFSEPEATAIKNYVESHSISAVVVWYSSAGGVYASSCGGDVSPETIAITDAYAKASGYPAYDSYDFYATTGDLVNWLAKKNIPAISVLLTTHKDTELAKNKSGLGALLQHYSK